MTNTKSMFEAIKQSLSSKKNEGGGSGLYKEILKFTAGNTYLVRLVPYPASPSDSIFKHFMHGWNSNATGKFVSAMCPTTFGENCPIDAYYLKTYRSGTSSEKEAAKVLSRKENWMVNVYVISDPTTPENEGKVKILRYSKELAKIIDSALSGDDAEEFGVERVFDVLGGCTLRIKCENRAEKGRTSKMVTYSSSKFLSASPLDLTEEDLKRIYDSVHDLKTVNKQNTPAEMQRLLDEHFFNLTTGSVYDETVTNDSEGEYSKQSLESVSNYSSTAETVEETDETTDETLKKLLADL